MLLNADKIPRWFNRARELALAEWREKFDFQRDEVFLRNPAAERKVEKFIQRVVLPAARTALKPTRFRLLGDRKGRNQQRPPDEFGNSVNLCLEDPDCPSCERPWFTRLEVNCAPHGASLLTEYLSIHLPLKTDFGLLVDVLSETFHEAFPAQLSIEQDPSGSRAFRIAFEHSAALGTEPGIEKKWPWTRQANAGSFFGTDRGVSA